MGQGEGAVLLDGSDPRFVVGPSTVPGGGRGLFAARRLGKGERLEVTGVLISKGSVMDQCTAYADPHKFRVGDQLLIPLGYGGIANHSATPNLEKIIEGEKVYLRTLRPIEAGEELFHTYSDYARERFGLADYR